MALEGGRGNGKDCGLKVTLSDVEPQVLRRFDVPLKIKLNRLHDVIQAAMGWTDTHLYEFRAGGVGWGVPDPDGLYDGPLPANKTSLFDVLEDVGTKQKWAPKPRKPKTSTKRL